jgi:hypothetical protein
MRAEPRRMSDALIIDVRWDGESAIWLATSADVPGLVIEAASWPSLIEETRLVLPDLLALNGHEASARSVTFRAEAHLELAGP